MVSDGVVWLQCRKSSNWWQTWYLEGDTLALNLIIVKGDQLNTENIDIGLKKAFTEGEFVWPIVNS